MKALFDFLQCVWETFGPISAVIVVLILVLATAIWWLERQGHRQHKIWKEDRDQWEKIRANLEEQHRTDRDEWIETTQEYADKMLGVVSKNTQVITELSVIIKTKGM